MPTSAQVRERIAQEQRQIRELEVRMSTARAGGNTLLGRLARVQRALHDEEDKLVNLRRNEMTLKRDVAEQAQILYDAQQARSITERSLQELHTELLRVEAAERMGRPPLPTGS
jgi:septal ring factor EnvC (AmiA/AmiB activator)